MQVTIVVPRRGINDEGKGKKHALYRLIAAATTDYVWMQDDDVVFNPRSPIPDTRLPIPDIRLPIPDTRYPIPDTRLPISDTRSPISDPRLPISDMIILPLRMVSKNEKPSLLERLQIAEYAAIQQLTIETAKRGKAVMCSGANLIAKRDRWLESYPDLHPEIPSGDDMFLLESFKRRGLKIAVSDDPRYEAIVRPHTSWRAFFAQRMRWAGKTTKYTDKDILRCGAMVMMANILQVLFPLFLLIKFPLEYRLIKRREPSVSVWTALILEIFYPFYILICLIGGLFRRQW